MKLGNQMSELFNKNEARAGELKRKARNDASL